jgi:hypothetical protein
MTITSPISMGGFTITYEEITPALATSRRWPQT